MNTSTQKIHPCLWFDRQAEEAADFYTAVFRNSEVWKVTRYLDVGQEIHGMEAGTVMSVDFTLEGYHFTALNGGPVFTFNPSISFMVHCPVKEEVDELWENLSGGGTTLMPLDAYPFSERYCWIQDKYGLSWQVIFSQSMPEQKVVPSLLFVGDVCGQAEEAITFYTSVFDGSEVGNILRYGPDQKIDKEGTVMHADFTLTGQGFTAMDSALEHDFAFNEAISFMVQCDSQKELDQYWEQLSHHKEAEQCGWLKDKYGISWQIVPAQLDELLSETDSGKATRVTEALLGMKKLVIADLRRAYEGQ